MMKNLEKYLETICTSASTLSRADTVTSQMALSNSDRSLLSYICGSDK